MTRNTLLFLCLMMLVQTGHASNTAGWFTRADVTGPDSKFVTQILSLPDGLIMTQHSEQGLGLVLGYDAMGAWYLSPTTASIRPAEDHHKDFLIGHDLHRVFTRPDDRFSNDGGQYRNFAGSKVRFKRKRNGQPTRMHLDNNEGESIRVDVSNFDADGLFRTAVFAAPDGLYTYQYSDVRPVDASMSIPVADPETVALLRWHRLHRMAHLAELPSLFVHGELLEVHGGELIVSSEKERQSMFTDYFGAVEFVDWRDTELPQLHFSDDRTMAWKAVRKEVVLNGSHSSTETQASRFAWLETWEKRDDVWRLTAVASTRAE